MSKPRHRNRPISSLKRKPATQEPKRIFYLFCEGRNTEPGYFAALKKKYQNQVLIQIDRCAGDPKSVTEKAREAKKKSRRPSSSHEKSDEYWAVFDRDEHYHYEQSVQTCRDNGISVARSNPCFELWLLLHICEYDSPGNRHEVSRLLQLQCPEYNPDHGKTLTWERLLDRIEHAEDYAAKQLERRVEERNPFGAPSTTVFELTRNIRSAAAKSGRKEPVG